MQIYGIYKELKLSGFLWPIEGLKNIKEMSIYTHIYGRYKAKPVF